MFNLQRSGHPSTPRSQSDSVSCFRSRTHRRCAQRGNTVEASRRHLADVPQAPALARANDTARADVRADGAARARDPARADLAARTGTRTRADARADDALARAGRSLRRCSLRTRRRGHRRRRGRRSCRDVPVGHPPKGTQKKSLDAAVA
jgi:hypothetical protein